VINGGGCQKPVGRFLESRKWRKKDGGPSTFYALLSRRRIRSGDD